MGDEPNPRVFSSPLTSTFSKNDVFSPLMGMNGEQNAPNMNINLYRDRNYFPPSSGGNLANPGLNGLNGFAPNPNSLNKNYSNMNLRNFDALNGTAHLEQSLRHNDYSLKNLQPSFDDKGFINLRQSRELKSIKPDPNIAAMNQMNKLKRPNFNETFNPGIGTYNNLNLNKLNGMEEVRQSMKLPAKNILVVDEGTPGLNKGLPSIASFREGSSLHGTNKGMKSVTSQTSLGRGVNMVDSADNSYLNNHMELSFRNGDVARNLEKMKSITNLDAKARFPKEVFSLNSKKKFCA